MMFFEQDSNSLTLTVTNVKNEHGVVRVLLFKGESGFPDDPVKAIKSASVKISGNKAVTVFENIPEGTYALSVFHDSQNTGKLRTNAFGIPRDGYGFSNNAMGTFGPPSFAKAAFKVTAGKNNVSIILR
jgi:uncharacterized protein (DUF2141 family)